MAPDSNAEAQLKAEFPELADTVDAVSQRCNPGPGISQAPRRWAILADVVRRVCCLLCIPPEGWSETMKHLYNLCNYLHGCRILVMEVPLLSRQYRGIVLANTGLQKELGPVRTKSELARPPVGRLLRRPLGRDRNRQPACRLVAVAGACRGPVRNSKRRPLGTRLALRNALAPKPPQQV